MQRSGCAEKPGHKCHAAGASALPVRFVAFGLRLPKLCNTEWLLVPSRCFAETRAVAVLVQWAPGSRDIFLSVVSPALIRLRC